MVGLDLSALQAFRAKVGDVIRVVIVDFDGSSPRETGSSMLISAEMTQDTIGGGALEFDAIATARDMLKNGAKNLSQKIPLGPNLGQCCGGTVTLLFENIGVLEDDIFARPIKTGTDMPLTVQAHLRELRRGSKDNMPVLIDDWFIEPVQPAVQPVWIYGAGHVGRAVVTVLAELPFDITWIDSSRDRFPTVIPPNVDMLVAANPADAVRHAPNTAQHFVFTYSHAIDLEICQRVLTREFARLGLIGSNTKRARFIKRLTAAGIDTTRLECPIGERSLGKEPMAIAIGVARSLLTDQSVDVIRNHKAHA